MKNILISAQVRASTGDIQSWHADYKVIIADNVRLLTIESRSAIDVVVSKLIDHSTILGTYARYYISAPNYGILYISRKVITL